MSGGGSVPLSSRQTTAQSYAGSPDVPGTIVSTPAMTHSMLVVSCAGERRIAQVAAVATAMTAAARTSTTGRRPRATRRARPSNGRRITPSSSSSHPPTLKTAAASTSETVERRRNDLIELGPLMFFSSAESDRRLVGECLTQAPPGAVQPQPNDGPARAERGCELVPGEALPRDEREQLPIGVAQRREGSRECARVAGRGERVEGGRVEARDETLGERRPSPVTSALIGDDPPGDAEEPGAKLLSLRAPVETSPQCD